MEREKKTDQILYKFRGAGLLGLCLLLFVSGLYYLGDEKEPGSMPASAKIRDEKFPICCVDTQQPKVSFSFDAACGGGRQRQIKKELLLNRQETSILQQCFLSERTP